MSGLAPLLGWLSSIIFSTGAVGLAIALNQSCGAPSQIAGVWIYKADQAKKGYPEGHWVNAGLLFFVAVGFVCMRIFYAYEIKKLMRMGADRLYKY